MNYRFRIYYDNFIVDNQIFFGKVLIETIEDVKAKKKVAISIYFDIHGNLGFDNTSLIGTMDDIFDKILISITEKIIDANTKIKQQTS